MKIVEVSNKQTLGLFHKTVHHIYNNDKNWVCQLHADVDKIFDPKTNPSFKNGGAKRWILLDEKQQAIGRIAAFYNQHEANKWKQPTGGIGFFECIDNQQAANLLFETSKNWLSSNGIEAMDGPVNFGENMFNWGLLVHGFQQQGYGMQYHKPYYQQLFENFGFQLFYKQFSFHLDLKKPFPEIFWKVAERVIQKPEISCRHFTFNEKHKFITDLIEIYDATWETFREESASLSYAEIDNAFNDARELLVEEFIWFVYRNNEPVCFMVLFPDANQLFKKLNGKLTLFTKLKMWYLNKSKTITRARALVMGTKPNYQRLGYESAIFWNLKKVFDKLDHYTEIELSWSGDFNPKIISLYEATGATHAKTHHTYRYMFDTTVPFERYHLPETNEIPRRARKSSTQK